MATDNPNTVGASLTPVVASRFPAEVASPDGRSTPGWRWVVGSAVFYLACLTVATWPALPRMATELPSRVDPLVHIWTMRWNKSCLLNGKLPFECPDIQYPVGAALGTLPPMHFQTLLYVPLSFVFANDVLCYNIIRTVAFLLTGVGTMLLVWHVLRDRWAATVGGMLAMLSQPMMFFSHAELEQITVGWFPIFLVAWTRWVDRPSGRGLAASAVLYLLVAMSAPYFGVFVVFPASLYVAWRSVVVWRSGAGFGSWWLARLAWFGGFAAITAPAVVVLFANQIWALRHGFSLTRPDFEFAQCRAPLWGYLIPSPPYRLGELLPPALHNATTFGLVPSYLGVVTLVFIGYAVLARVRFARRGYWWTTFLMLLVLSLGAHTWVGGYDLGLPAAWLKKHFIGFRMIRVPARFNLFAAVGAALVAAAGLHHLLTRIRSTGGRRVLLGVVTGVALLDLSVAPYHTLTVPPVPPCYDFILKQDPHATIADIPYYNDGAFQLASLSTYWQSFHHARTTAGYTAFINRQQENLMARNSPFSALRLADTEFLARPAAEHFELAHDQDFLSYVWLYLTTHQVRYVVLHQTAAAFPELLIHPERTRALLQTGAVYQDDQTTVYDRDRLPRPTRPVFVYDRGWGHRVIRRGDPTVMLGPVGRVMVYVPDATEPLALTLDVAGHKTARRVTLQADGVDLTRWTVAPSDVERIASPPFHLTAGLHELSITSDGAAKSSRTDVHVPGDTTPFSLWISGIHFGPAQAATLAGRLQGERIVR